MNRTGDLPTPQDNRDRASIKRPGKVLFWSILLFGIIGVLYVHSSRQKSLVLQPEEPESESGSPTFIDLATTETSHTAQLTLISILQGVIMGAIITSAPQIFYTLPFSPNIIDLDLRALATLLAAIDLWIKYSWGILVVRWPFSLPHNLLYSLVCICMLGFAISVNQLNAWLLWGSITCFMCCFAYIFNTWIAIQEQRHRKDYARLAITSEDPEPTSSEISILKATGLVESGMILLPPATVVGYLLLIHYHLGVPYIPGLGWGAFVTCFIISDILYQGLVAMPQQRYGKILHTKS